MPIRSTPLVPALVQTIADPYVMAKRAGAAEVEAHAINDAINEFREWEMAKSPAKLLREWGKKGRPTT